MTGQDLVSIVVPVYNSEAYLVRCIRSLQSQSYENLEMILVDDGSSDHSLDICRREAEADRRIQVLHKENGGVASARNAGMEIMTGRWLMLIDADDYIHPDMVRDLVRAAKGEEAQAAICGFERVFADGTGPEAHQLEGRSGSDILAADGSRRKQLEGIRWKDSEGDVPVWSGTLHEFSEAMLLPLYRNLMLRTQSNKLYFVPLIRQHHLVYPAGISINEDIWFCVRYLTFCRRIACIPGSYLYYWQNDAGGSQISRYHPEGVESCFLLLSAVQELMQASTASPDIRRKMDNEMLFHICGFAGHIYYRTASSAEACYESVRTLAARPEFRQLLVGMKPEGLKNQVAALLLKHRMCGLYHGMCLALYRKQRKELLRSQSGKTTESKQGSQAGKTTEGNQGSQAELHRRMQEGIENVLKKDKKERKTGAAKAACAGSYDKKADTDEILVSVSCITFNHEAYIARALDSFLMQKTNFKYEILVYDDASTDRTQDIIREYEKKYPDIIKPYYQTENQYSQGKYNVEGFFNYPRARGKYIAMCDGDDYWTDEKKLQMQVDYMEQHPECAMCLHAARIETQEKAIQSLEIRPYHKSCLIPAEKVIDKPSNYPTASLLFRTEYTRDLQDYYYVSPVGDIPIQIHMAAKGTVYYMDRKMSVYQQGVSVSWSALMKQGNYKQNLMDHHNAMKVMYRGFAKETGGIYNKAIQRACRRMDFLTLINVKEYKEALAPCYRGFYRELDLRTRFFIRFEMMAPGLYRGLRRLVFGKDRC